MLLWRSMELDKRQWPLSLCQVWYQIITRVHSSRMRTACLLPISPIMHCLQWGVPGLGCTCPRVVYLVLEGVPDPGGVPGPGGYLRRYSTSPLWTEWLTDRCKNITLPQTSFAGGKYAWGTKPSPLKVKDTHCITLEPIWTQSMTSRLYAFI